MSDKATVTHSSTDIWMPLYIGDYLSATTHLSAEESGGYLHLLMHQWKNGSLPDQDENLRRIARIDKDSWGSVWTSLKQFFDFSDGFPVQKRLEAIRAEWQERKAKAEAKAHMAAEKRWARRHRRDAPSIAPSIAPSNAQGMHKRCPSTSSSSSKKKSSSSRRSSGEGDCSSKPRVATERTPDPRHYPFRLEVQKYWESKNHGVAMPWDGRTARVMSNMLRSNPALDLATFTSLLRSRAGSELNHAARPCDWLDKITNFAGGPLDKFGHPKGEQLGRSTESPAGNRINATQRGLRNAAIAFGYDLPDKPSRADGDGISKPGPGSRHAHVPAAVRPSHR